MPALYIPSSGVGEFVGLKISGLRYSDPHDEEGNFDMMVLSAAGMHKIETWRGFPKTVDAAFKDGIDTVFKLQIGSDNEIFTAEFRPRSLRTAEELLVRNQIEYRLDEQYGELIIPRDQLGVRVVINSPEAPSVEDSLSWLAEKFARGQAERARLEDVSVITRDYASQAQRWRALGFAVNIDDQVREAKVSWRDTNLVLRRASDDDTDETIVPPKIRLGHPVFLDWNDEVVSEVGKARRPENITLSNGVIISVVDRVLHRPRVSKISTSSSSLLVLGIIGVAVVVAYACRKKRT